MTISKSRFL